ncbi:MAG: J domain-containing protein [Byssovorax sp.]
MLLPGRLSASTLGDLLGALHRERTSGRLDLSEIRGPQGRSVPGRAHRIHLSEGLVTSVETQLPVPPLGEILKRKGTLDSALLVTLLRRIDGGDPRSTGEILVTERMARAEAVRAGLEQQLRQRLDALFDLEDAQIAFRVARPASREIWSARPLAPGDFLHGRPRRRDGAKAPPRASSRAANDDREPPPPRSGPRVALALAARDQALALLGLGDRAEAAEVRKAFRRLAGQLHPDRFESAPVEERRKQALQFARISAAYHVLVA